MKPRQEDFKRPMFDIQVDLDEISLNINRDQVKHKKSHDHIGLISNLLVFRFT
jgi:hypothetical protein